MADNTPNKLLNDWPNLGLTFVGGGGWDIFGRIERQRGQLASEVNLVDTGPVEYAKLERPNLAQWSIQSGYHLTGAGRNPFRTRVLFNHFRAYFEKLLVRRVMVYVGCPGGGFSSYALYLLAALPPFGRANICLGVVSGRYSSIYWPVEACNVVLALPRILGAFPQDGPFLATILVESDEVMLAHRAGMLGPEKEDWRDLVASNCAAVLDGLSYYENPLGYYVRNPLDWALQRPQLGVQLPDLESHRRPLYLVPMLFPGTSASIASQNPASVASEAPQLLSQLRPLCRVMGKPQGAKLVVAGPKKYLHRYYEVDMKNNLSHWLDIPLDSLEVVLCPRESLAEPQGWLFLVSPPLPLFGELKDVADRYGSELVEAWKASLEDLKHWQGEISEISPWVADALPHADLPGWDEFESRIDEELMNVNENWEKARAFLNRLVNWSESQKTSWPTQAAKKKGIITKIGEIGELISSGGMIVAPEQKALADKKGK